MRRAYLLAIPLLLLLKVAAEIERQAREAQPAQRVRTFLASDIRAGSVCLNRFSGLIGGASAGFRPPRSAAAG